MKVVVDTSVWSLALRRRAPSPSPHTELLAELIRDGRVVLLGMVRQELLSGIRHPEQSERLRRHLRAFPDLPLETEDHETAAAFFNTCMSHGVQGTPVDLLLCACAHRRNYALLTMDPDFDHYGRHLPLNLLKPGAA
ncbi:MAG: PIN domain-containing protein [Chthoniobacteraceae bacterium]|nr:PIN domain-containing protein [Chthoniobacteraceae bacterium]